MLSVVCLLLFTTSGSAVRISRSVESLTRSGAKCLVKERHATSEHSSFEMSFALDLSVIGIDKCNNVANCNYFHFKDTLVKAFIDPPDRVPKTGRYGKCKCYLKSDFVHDGNNLLVDFRSTPTEECNEATCWLKYNEFVAVATWNGGDRSRIRSIASTARGGNHWEIKCADSNATTSFMTVPEMVTSQPGSKDREMATIAKELGIIPVVRTKAVTQDAIIEAVDVNHVTKPKDDEIADVSEDKELADVSEHAQLQDVFDFIRREGQNSVVKETLQMNEMRPMVDPKKLWSTALAKIRQRHTQAEVIQTLEEFVAEKPVKNLDIVVEAQTVLPTSSDENMRSLETALHWQEQVQGKLINMLLAAERLQGITAMVLERGSVDLADISDWVEVDILRLNTLFLINLLDESVSNVLAFSEATELEVDEDVLQELLSALVEGMQIQEKASQDLTELILIASTMNSKMQENDIIAANTLALETMSTIGNIKYDVRAGLEKLKKALAKIRGD